MQEIITIIFYPALVNQSKNGSLLKTLTRFSFTRTVEAQAAKIVIEESHGTQSQSSFHTLCYHNQMDTLYARKTGELNQNFRRSPSSYNATKEYSKKIPRDAKKLALSLSVGNCYSLPPQGYGPAQRHYRHICQITSLYGGLCSLELLELNLLL